MHSIAWPAGYHAVVRRVLWIRTSASFNHVVLVAAGFACLHTQSLWMEPDCKGKGTCWINLCIYLNGIRGIVEPSVQAVPLPFLVIGILAPSISSPKPPVQDLSKIPVKMACKEATVTLKQQNGDEKIFTLRRASDVTWPGLIIIPSFSGKTMRPRLPTPMISPVISKPGAAHALMGEACIMRCSPTRKGIQSITNETFPAEQAPLYFSSSFNVVLF